MQLYCSPANKRKEEKKTRRLGLEWTQDWTPGPRPLLNDILLPQIDSGPLPFHIPSFRSSPNAHPASNTGCNEET